MKKMLVLSLILSFLWISQGFCYWIWTPKTGKWINPKYAVKSTPKEQFDLAKSLYDAKDYKTAQAEFKKLIRYYPESFEASEAQFYLGSCYENLQQFYEAYLAYQKVLDKYPFTKRTDEIIHKEFDIAEKFLSGQKRKAMGVPLPVDNPAIEIYQKVIDNSEYGKLAPLAQYKLGLVLRDLSRFSEAEEAFGKVISKYPESEWAEAAKYQIAFTLASISQKADYDQKPSEEAKQKFEEFLKAHPQAKITEQAEAEIEKIKDRQAQNDFKVAQFYEKQKDYAAAELYYEDIIANYPQTIWQAKAIARLEAIGKAKNK